MRHFKKEKKMSPLPPIQKSKKFAAFFFLFFFFNHKLDVKSFTHHVYFERQRVKTFHSTET